MFTPCELKPAVRRGRILIALVALAGPLGVVWAQDVGREAVQQQGVLLLRNGQTIEGTITQSNEGYCVLLREGEIRVRRSEVEFCCGSLEECYLRMRAAARLGDVYEHLRLAQWCLRQGLVDSATRELSDASAIDPAHPMIAVLRRRLETQTQRPAQTIDPGKTVLPAVTSDDLDRMVRGLPAGTIEAFTQRIQPLLLNNCTAANCHNSQSENGFRLIRTPPEKPPSRRLTQRNLHATLRWINRGDPAASKLLTAALQAHGSAKAAVFADAQATQYQRLAEWVRQVAQPANADPAVTAKPTTKRQDAPPRQPQLSRRTPKENPAKQSLAAGGLDLSGADRSAGPSAADGPSPLAKGRDAGRGPNDPNASAGRPGANSGLPPPESVPSDPFDPEIFNRRYFGQR